MVSVGPANMSMPVIPKSMRFASATYALPGPTMMSAGWPEKQPYPMAPIACTPPTQRMTSAPAKCIAYRVPGWILPVPLSGGDAATTFFTPATLAVATLIIALETCENRPTRMLELHVFFERLGQIGDDCFNLLFAHNNSIRCETIELLCNFQYSLLASF